jgi:hypothetical protein
MPLPCTFRYSPRILSVVPIASALLWFSRSIDFIFKGLINGALRCAGVWGEVDVWIHACLTSGIGRVSGQLQPVFALRMWRDSNSDPSAAPTVVSQRNVHKVTEWDVSRNVGIHRLRMGKQSTPEWIPTSMHHVAVPQRSVLVRMCP